MIKEMEPEKYKKQIEEILDSFQRGIDHIRGEKVEVTEADIKRLELAQILLANLADFNLSLTSIPGKLIGLDSARALRRNFREKFGGADLPNLPLLFKFNKIQVDAVLLRTLLAPNGINSISVYFGYDKTLSAIKLLLVPEDNSDMPMTNKGADVLDEMRPCPPPGCNDLI